MKNTLLLSIFVSLFCGSWVSAQSMYSYTRLALKDLDEMNAIIQGKLNESSNALGDSKLPPLREALQAVFARSNEDLMIEKVITPLRNALDDLDAWESSMDMMVDDAIKGLKDPDKIKPVAQVTYLIMLENVLQEFKPKAMEKYEASVINRIRDAKIELTKAASKERRLKTMKNVKSPSEIAAGIQTAPPKTKKK